MPDDTYIAQQIGGVAVYAGYLTHWWGPGWISALSLSNNASPIPQIGISRLGTTPSRPAGCPGWAPGRRNFLSVCWMAI